MNQIIILNSETLKQNARPIRMNFVLNGICELYLKEIKQILGRSYSDTIRIALFEHYKKFKRDLEKKEFVSAGDIKNES